MVGRTAIRFLHVNRRFAAASNFAAFATAAAVVVATHDVVEAASGSGDGTDDYIAMSSPCESPVGRKLHVNKDGQNAASEPSNSTSSTSSRSGLVTRLSSALQSWTSGRGSVDDGSRLGPPREGRPGPYGAKYTQEGMMKTKINEHPAVAATGGIAKGGLPEEGNKESIENPSDRSNPCETDASPHLRGRVNDPYLLAVAAAPAVSKNVQEGLEGTSAWSTSDSAVTAGSSVDQGNQGKKKGLWEWKAERSRLDQAIREAEAERDREKARANEAAILLKEVMTHPDVDKRSDAT